MSTSENNSFSTREKYLMIFAVITVVAVVIPVLYNLYGGSSKGVFANRDKLRKEVADLEESVQRGQKLYNRRLEDFSKRSLPAINQAKSDYQKWLSDQAKKNGFQNSVANITSTSAKSDKTGFKVLQFKLSGQATLANLNGFLKDFYQAANVHLIKSISLKPVDKTDKLDIILQIESFSLEQNKPRNWELQMVDNDSQSYIDGLGRDVAVIDTRAFFSAYKPQVQEPTAAEPPPTKLPNDGYSDAMCTYVKGLVEVNGVYQVWIERRLKGDRLILHVGDHLEIDGVDCIVRSISFDKLVIEVEGTLYIVRNGKSFEEFEEDTSSDT